MRRLLRLLPLRPLLTLLPLRSLLRWLPIPAARLIVAVRRRRIAWSRRGRWQLAGAGKWTATHAGLQRTQPLGQPVVGVTSIGKRGGGWRSGEQCAAARACACAGTVGEATPRANRHTDTLFRLSPGQGRAACPPRNELRSATSHPPFTTSLCSLRPGLVCACLNGDILLIQEL